ncbi:hypothetical protein LINPERPRIM_LOCUS18447 [Linum perenne]
MKNEETSVSWVGGIYRKIEALYLEADDMIRQEAHDFMENHLQPVSANVKHLYEELVRDVQLPQSSSDESTEVAQPDLVLNETTDSFTNVSFDVADENKENQLDFPKEEKDLGKSDVTKTELSSLQNEGSKASFEESDSRGDSELSEDLSDELFESVSSLDVQSLVAVDLGNSSEDEITAGNLDHCNNEASSSISRSAVKLEESCILVDDDDEDYVLSRREKRHWYSKKNWKQPVLALASKSMKQKQSHSVCPSAVACLETREHEEAAFLPPIADENSESDWEIV